MLRIATLAVLLLALMAPVANAQRLEPGDTVSVNGSTYTMVQFIVTTLDTGEQRWVTYPNVEWHQSDHMEIFRCADADPPLPRFWEPVKVDGAVQAWVSGYAGIFRWFDWGSGFETASLWYRPGFLARISAETCVRFWANWGSSTSSRYEETDRRYSYIPDVITGAEVERHRDAVLTELLPLIRVR